MTTNCGHTEGPAWPRGHAGCRTGPAALQDPWCRLLDRPTAAGSGQGEACSLEHLKSSGGQQVTVTGSIWGNREVLEILVVVARLLLKMQLLLLNHML